MDNGNEAISISQYNEILKSVIFNEYLLPDDCSDIKYYYMELNNDTGKRQELKENHSCKTDYLEYYWVEFAYRGREYVVSFFHRDFDCKNGDIHVMPGVLQVWERINGDNGKPYKFMKDKQIEGFSQSVKSNQDSTIYFWNPLIDYKKIFSNCFVWVPNHNIHSLNVLISVIVSEINITIDVSDFRMKYNLDVSVTNYNKKAMFSALKNRLRERAFTKLNKKDLIKFDHYGVNNYQYFYHWTETLTINEEKGELKKGDKYFICPYKHINTDYGYFIRFDGKPIAYKVKYEYNVKNALKEFPNTLNEITGCFEIKYDYANAEDVINASKGK